LNFLYACEKSYDVYYPYETTVTVVNMQGKPLTGQTVQATGGGRFTVTGITDINGRATLQYKLFLPSTAAAESANITVKNDVFLSAINSGYHIANSHTDKFSCTIQMDSLIPFKVRLLRSDTTLVNFAFTGVWLEQNNARLSHKFVDWVPKNIGTIDSIFTLSTWQNTPFEFWISADKNGLSYGKTLYYKVKSQDFRDTMMFIRL
jgi:hypothetical protein